MKPATVNTGKALKIIMAKRGISTNDLAALYGCNQGRISNLRNSKSMGWEAMERLCSIFEIKVSEFIAEGEEE